MPYFVYKITPDSTPSIKNIELIDSIDAYKDARSLARSIRAQLGSNDLIVIKIIFADNQLEAEQRLTEVREAPLLKEWEK